MPTRVIAVDDDRRILEIVRHFLQEKGYEVHIFANADEALETARNAPFDVMILDMVLQGTDGYRVSSELKRNPSTADLPVLFLSAKVEVAELFLREFHGIADFLGKPFRRDDLLSKLERLLARKAACAGKDGRKTP